MFSLDPYTTTVVNPVADPASTAQTGDISSIIPSDRVRLKRLRPGDNVVLEDMGDAIRIATNTISNPAVLMDPSDLDLLADDGHTIKRLRAGDHIVMTSEPDHIRIGSVGPVSAAAVGGVSLVQPDNFVIKDLKAGTNITLDNTDDCVIIHSTASGGGSLPSLTTVGSGLSWVDDGALHHIRGIQNLGTHLQVTLSEDGKDIQLRDTFTPYTPTVLTGTGGSYTLAHTATPLGVKGLSAGTNISIVPSDTDVTINNTYSYTETPLTTSGTGTSLKKSDHTLKDLKAGSLITLTATEDDVTIQGVAPTALSSAGTGSTSLVGSATQSLKSLQAGTHIDLVTDGDTITVHNTYSYTPTVLSNAGTNGVSLVGTAAQSLKSLVPGSNITLTTNGDEVTLAAAASTFTETPVTTTGTGTSLLKSGHTLKDLKAGANVTLTNNTDDVTIATTYSETATTSAGATGGVSLINANHVIKDLKAGTNITLDTTDPKCVVLNSVDPEVPITTTGTGTSLLKGGYVLKDLKAGSNISLTSTTDDITIAYGSAWPKATFTYDFSYLAGFSIFGGPTLMEPRGNPSPGGLICNETRVDIPALTFWNSANTTATTLTYQIHLTTKKPVLYGANGASNMRMTTYSAVHGSAGGNTVVDFEPFVVDSWLVLVWGASPNNQSRIWYVNKTDGTGPRISVHVPATSNCFRITVSNTGYTNECYWDVRLDGTTTGTILSLTTPSHLNHSEVFAFSYNETRCKIMGRGMTSVVTSPPYSDWTSSTVTTLTTVARNTLWPDASYPYNVPTTKNAIGGNVWYLGTHPSYTDIPSPYTFQALRFYPSMTDAQLQALYNHTYKEYWCNLNT